MTQQLSPWLEGAYGWNFGEGGWNTGMDENLLKFSFMFGGNVDSIVASLPPVSNGAAHFNSADNRFYFGVGSIWYSSPCPKSFIFKIKSNGDFYQFNGTSAVKIDNPSEIDSRLSSLELTVSSLGTAAFQNVEDFATQAELDVVEGQAQGYTDALKDDLANSTDPAKGAGLVGRAVVSVETMADMLAIPADARKADLTYIVKGFHLPANYLVEPYSGGGMYLWVGDQDKAGHNGVTVIDPAAPFPSDWGDSLQVSAFFQHSGAGVGCFVLESNVLHAAQFGLINDAITRDQTVILQQIIDVSSAIGARVQIGSGTFRATQLLWKNQARLAGAGIAETTLLAIDPLAGSFLTRVDNGAVYNYGEITGISFATALSSIAAAQDNNPNLYALNLVGVPRHVFRDIAVSGFGAGAIVLGRAEGGAEGFGFVNTTRDGNHNRFYNLFITSCGKYGAWENSAIYGVYKANANHFYGVTGAGTSASTDGRLIGIRYGGGNRFFGVTAESMRGIVAFGALSTGNDLYGVYGENLTNPVKSEPRDSASYRNNSVIGANINTYTGSLVDDSGDRRVMFVGDNRFAARFGGPATTNLTVNYAQNLAEFYGFLVDDAAGEPLVIRSRSYGSVDELPRVQFVNSYVGSAGDLAAIQFNNQRSGVNNRSAEIAATLGGAGYARLVLRTGRATRSTDTLVVNPIVDDLTGGAVTPGLDNVQTLGSSSNRWSTVFAATGTINTSDEREKVQQRGLHEAERAAALELKSAMCAFKWKEAVERKDDKARWHFGVMAQEIMRIFERHGLDAHEYGMFCYDEWEEQLEATQEHPAKFDEGGVLINEAWVEVVQEYQPAGNRYGVRYDQMLAFIVAAL
jgi:hypothetical protein